MRCIIYQLGLMAYGEAYRLQRELHQQRFDGRITDTLLLLEHPPTITIGKSGKLENVLADQSQLAERGISLFFTDRGGDATYHGPGQLVGYPLIDLRERGRDVHRYVHDLEEVLLRTLSSFGIEAERDESHAGVWVGDTELAAIGIGIRKWVTMHGFALNVKPKLEHFSLINPCGFCSRKATSMARLLAADVSLETVMERLLPNFAEVFDAQLELGSDIRLRSVT